MIDRTEWPCRIDPATGEPYLYRYTTEQRDPLCPACIRGRCVKRVQWWTDPGGVGFVVVHDVARELS